MYVSYGLSIGFKIEKVSQPSYKGVSSGPFPRPPEGSLSYVAQLANSLGLVALPIMVAAISIS